ncbi:hypothetical protein [Pseudomonas veronii]|uniref:Uncharacterized protein n=1 Tax=Pseudomonas veronii TaxID=76761 RepID=A0A4P7Y863_PSEVE|nr:hypothetical protein [Pseudomonas veronii]QCG66710.2 hypothetical protein E4167_18595 [Pseudomonas veronii]
MIGNDDPLGSSVFRTKGFNSIRTTAASKSVTPFIFSVQATDNAARPSELVNRAYESRSLKIDRRYFSRTGR